jgi:hypothetical protein
MRAIPSPIALAVILRAMDRYGVSVSDPRRHELLLHRLLADPDILDAVDRHMRRRKPRGQRATSHAEAKQIAQRWEVYQRNHGDKSVQALAKGFLASLPGYLAPKPNSRSRGRAPSSKTLSNIIGRGKALNEQRPILRRYVAALRGIPSAAPTRLAEIKAILRTARLGGSSETAPLKGLAAQAEYIRLCGERALLGDKALSFITISEK